MIIVLESKYDRFDFKIKTCNILFHKLQLMFQLTKQF